MYNKIIDYASSDPYYVRNRIWAFMVFGYLAFCLLALILMTSNKGIIFLTIIVFFFLLALMWMAHNILMDMRRVLVLKKKVSGMIFLDTLVAKKNLESIFLIKNVSNIIIRKILINDPDPIIKKLKSLYDKNDHRSRYCSGDSFDEYLGENYFLKMTPKQCIKVIEKYPEAIQYPILPNKL